MRIDENEIGGCNFFLSLEKFTNLSLILYQFLEDGTMKFTSVNLVQRKNVKLN